MTFQFAPARREQVSLLIALAGASGSGKTYSALRLARGMAPSGKIAFIDTEARRGLHYAEQFDFMHADMRPAVPPRRIH
jgi:ABC-type microcin C transport system duplicated ATPase subunit YejF